MAKVACGQIFPFPVKSKYFPQHPAFENSQLLFFPNTNRPSKKSKTKGKITVKMHRKLGRRRAQCKQCGRVNVFHSNPDAAN
jgi:hypothetical protein